MRPEDVFLALFFIFGRFGVARGPPRMAPKPPKIQKTPSKNDGRKRHVFEDVFLAMFGDLCSQNGLNMASFFNFSENVDLVKNLVFPW